MWYFWENDIIFSNVFSYYVEASLLKTAGKISVMRRLFEENLVYNLSILGNTQLANKCMPRALIAKTSHLKYNSGLNNSSEDHLTNCVFGTFAIDLLHSYILYSVSCSYNALDNIFYRINFNVDNQFLSYRAQYLIKVWNSHADLDVSSSLKLSLLFFIRFL